MQSARLLRKPLGRAESTGKLFGRILIFWHKQSLRLEGVSFASVNEPCQMRARKRSERVARVLDNCIVDLRNQGMCKEANECFAMKCIIESHGHFLDLWIHFKNDRFDEAWCALVMAQETCRTALQVSSMLTNTDSRLDSLLTLEKWLFPPQMGMSVGGYVKRSTCSICGALYGECEHIKGRMYCGELCARVIEEYELQEVSLTPNPANRLCRVYVLEGTDTLTKAPRTEPRAGEPL